MDSRSSSTPRFLSPAENFLLKCLFHVLTNKLYHKVFPLEKIFFATFILPEIPLGS